jgi:hypothetical protein
MDWFGKIKKPEVPTEVETSAEKRKRLEVELTKLDESQPAGIPPSIIEGRRKNLLDAIKVLESEQ